MRKLTISFAAVALVGFAAAQADAQCAFDGPAKAKGMKTSLVRSYAGCPSITFPAPQSQTETNVPTCAPPFAHSVFQFNNKSGKCDFKTSAKLEAPCSNLSGDNCMNMSVQAKCSGIVAADGVTPIDGLDNFGAGWALTTVTRATLNDPGNGDMTVIDFPVQIGFPLASKGKIGFKDNTNEILDRLGLSALPECTQLEVISLSVQDPDGQPFAKIGASTRPKGL
jgi:hypothetical protein